MSENSLSKLKNFYREHGRMPSYAELAKLLEFKSKCGAQYIVRKWLEKGIINKDERGKLLPGKLLQPLKILGTVVAGFPSPAEEEQVDSLSLDDWLIENKEASFLLKVTGDSMIDAGILPGDRIILHRGKQPKSGDIVVAEVDGQWTLKYFQKKGSKVQLVAANKSYPSIVPRQEMRIAGVVTASVRKY